MFSFDACNDSKSHLSRPSPCKAALRCSSELALRFALGMCLICDSCSSRRGAPSTSRDTSATKSTSAGNLGDSQGFVYNACMTTNDVPNWKFWHPLSFGKAFGIVAVIQIVFQIGFALFFVALQMSGSTGAYLGVCVGGGVGAIVIYRLAAKAKASAASDSDDA